MVRKRQGPPMESGAPPKKRRPKPKPAESTTGAVTTSKNKRGGGTGSRSKSRGPTTTTTTTSDQPRRRRRRAGTTATTDGTQEEQQVAVEQQAPAPVVVVDEDDGVPPLETAKNLLHEVEIALFSVQPDLDATKELLEQRQQQRMLYPQHSYFPSTASNNNNNGLEFGGPNNSFSQQQQRQFLDLNDRYNATLAAAAAAMISNTGGYSNTNHELIRTGDSATDRLYELSRNYQQRQRQLQPETKGPDRWDRPHRCPGQRRRRIARDIDQPNAPNDPPPTGYVIFVGQMTCKIRHDRPDQPHHQPTVVQGIAKMWKEEMAESERQYYMDFAKEARQEYTRQQMEYRATGYYTPSTVFERLGNKNATATTTAAAAASTSDPAGDENATNAVTTTTTTKTTPAAGTTGTTNTTTDTANATTDTTNTTTAAPTTTTTSSGPWVRIDPEEKNELEREISSYETVCFPLRPAAFDEDAHLRDWRSKVTRKLKDKKLLAKDWHKRLQRQQQHQQTATTTTSGSPPTATKASSSSSSSYEYAQYTIIAQAVDHAKATFMDAAGESLETVDQSAIIAAATAEAAVKLLEFQNVQMDLNNNDDNHNHNNYNDDAMNAENDNNDDVDDGDDDDDDVAY